MRIRPGTATPGRLPGRPAGSRPARDFDGDFRCDVQAVTVFLRDLLNSHTYPKLLPTSDRLLGYSRPTVAGAGYTARVVT